MKWGRGRGPNPDLTRPQYFQMTYFLLFCLLRLRRLRPPWGTSPVITPELFISDCDGGSVLPKNHPTPTQKFLLTSK